MNFYIADLHFGHMNIIRFDERPFRDIKEMEESIIKNWNNVVKRGDTVYILGDFCWDKSDEWVRIVDLLYGNKVLIVGNHDLTQYPAILKSKFQDITHYKEIADNGKKVIMCHYPILMYNGCGSQNCYMLCGHVHTTPENDLLEKWRGEVKSRYNVGNIINIGCMMPYMNYTPQTLEHIVDEYKKG